MAIRDRNPVIMKEVLEHGDAGIDQEGLCILVGCSQGHVVGQAVEALYAPG